MSPDRLPHPAWWLPLVLMALALLVYGPGLAGGFLFDDYPNLVLDPDWKLTTLSLEQIQRALGHGIASPLGRPLAILSFAFNHALAGMDPYWLKFTNVLLHAASAVLVWWLTTRLLALAAPRGEAGMGARNARWAGALVAALWMLHPLQVSSVLYIVQRMEMGAALGILAAVYGYLRGRQAQIAGQRAWPWFAVAAVATLFGFGFKETAVLIPGYTFLVEALLLRFRTKGGRLSRTWAALYSVGLLGALAAYALVVARFAGPDTLYAIRDFNLVERLLTQPVVLWVYLKQILLPLPDSMWFYYDNFPVSRGLLDPATTLFAMLGLVSLLVLGWCSRKRWPLVSLGIGWFFVSHVLTSNVIPLELAFEHRNYLALLGVLLALATPAAWLLGKLHLDARIAVAAVVLLATAGLCAVQAATWGDPVRLAWTLENRNPASPRASYGLAKELLTASNGDQTTPMWSMARKQFLNAAELPGNSILALQGAIQMDARAGRESDAATWDTLRARLAGRPLGPEDLSALHAMNHCLISLACTQGAGQMFRTYLVVIEHNPHSAAAFTLYANFAWNVLNDRPLAIRSQRKAVSLSPANPRSRAALAKFLLGTGGSDERAEAAKLVTALRRQNQDGSLDEVIADVMAVAAAPGGAASALDR